MGWGVGGSKTSWETVSNTLARRLCVRERERSRPCRGGCKELLNRGSLSKAEPTQFAADGKKSRMVPVSSA